MISHEVLFSYIISLHHLGNVYIVDTNNQGIRKVTVSTGIITTFAGSGGTGSYSGNNGPATAATLNSPSRVALDSAGNSMSHFFIFLFYFTHFFLPRLGNVYIADYLNNCIRKVTVSTGIITIYAGGSGSGTYSGDNGAATSAGLDSPRGVAFDSLGTYSLLFIPVNFL